MKKLGENTKLLIFLALIFGMLNFFIPPIKSEAYGQFFGDKVTSKIKCTCKGSTNYQVTMANGDKYSLEPTARLYSHYNVRDGSWLLGGYRSGGTCKMQAYPDCTVVTMKGTISFIGISGLSF